MSLDFHPDENWLVTANFNSFGFWPLTHRFATVLDQAGGRVQDVKFTPNGEWLVTVTAESRGSRRAGQLWVWPMKEHNNRKPRVLFESPSLYRADLGIDPIGRYVAIATQEGSVYLVPLDGGPAREFRGPGWAVQNHLLAFSPDGRRFAAVGRRFGGKFTIWVWDVDSDEGRAVGTVEGSSASLSFVDDNRIRWTGNSIETEGRGGAEKIFDIEKGHVEVVAEGGTELRRAVSSAGDFVVTTDWVSGTFGRPKNEINWKNLVSGETRRIRSHGESPYAIALDPTDRLIVSGSFDDDLIRVGPVSGGAPHLLFGHDDRVLSFSGSLPGWAVDCIGQQRLYGSTLADARHVETAAPHPPP